MFSQPLSPNVIQSHLTSFDLIQSLILQLPTPHKPPSSTPNLSTHLHPENQACPKDADAFHQSWPQQTPRKAEKSRPVASAERPERRSETRELGPVKAPRAKAPMKCWQVDKLTHPNEEKTTPGTGTKKNKGWGNFWELNWLL